MGSCWGKEREGASGPQPLPAQLAEGLFTAGSSGPGWTEIGGAEFPQGRQGHGLSQIHVMDRVSQTRDKVIVSTQMRPSSPRATALLAWYLSGCGALEPLARGSLGLHPDGRQTARPCLGGGEESLCWSGLPQSVPGGQIQAHPQPP